jgi:hypothetical protein
MWLIREDGQGPGMMIYDRSNGKDHGLKGMTALAVSALASSPFNPQRWITRFIYGRKNWFRDGSKVVLGDGFPETSGVIHAAES